MRPSLVLDLQREAVREAASRHRTANLRVFGTALHGTDEDGSDLDLLVDALPGATLFDLGDLQVELEDMLGRTQRAVVMSLIVIGEAATKVMDQFDPIEP